MPGQPRAYCETNQRGFKSWLDAYVNHQRFSESPSHFHYWTGVAVLAGALRRKVWIEQLHFQWTPNMYILLVAPAGVAAKSTTMRSGISLLQAVEGVKFGPASGTWQAVLDAFKKAEEHTTYPGLPDPIPMSCLTIAVGELGTFFRPENGEFADLLTAMWDGQKEGFSRHTVGRGEINLLNPWLNLIACTTPSWLKTNFPADLIGGGLTSRIVFVYGDRKQNLVAYPAEKIPDEAYKLEHFALLKDLQAIAELAGEYKMTREAIDLGTHWYENEHHNGKVPSHLASGRFDGYMARKQTHVHKLAMVLAASRRNDLVVEARDLQEAIKITTELETDMLQVFNSIGVSETARQSSEVVTLIRNFRSVTNSKLFAILHKTMDLKMYKEGIENAVAAGLIRKEQVTEPSGKIDWKLTYVGGARTRAGTAKSIPNTGDGIGTKAGTAGLPAQPEAGE